MSHYKAITKFSWWYLSQFDGVSNSSEFSSLIQVVWTEVSWLTNSSWATRTVLSCGHGYCRAAERKTESGWICFLVLRVIGGVAAAGDTTTGSGVDDVIADRCRMQRLTFQRFPLVSQKVFPAAFAILNGSENTGANFCAVVGSFTRTHLPALNRGCAAWNLRLWLSAMASCLYFTRSLMAGSVVESVDGSDVAGCLTCSAVSVWE